MTRWALLGLAAGLAACGGGGGGGSGGGLPPPGAPLVKASAATPFATGCTAFPGSTVLYRDAEVEPHLAVDPTNPSRLLGGWQQDRFSDGGARGLLAARSSDGGATWARAALATSRCGGGGFDRASDPWFAFGADGRAYAITLAFDQGNGSGDNAVLVFRSLDGGATFGAPTTLIADGAANFNDKEALAADPGDLRYAYAGWDRLTSDDRGPAMFARTTDGGVTWEAAREVYDPGVGNQVLNVTPAVAPDGTVYLFFTRFLGAAVDLATMRSTDHGATFSAPVRLAYIQPNGTRDPGDGDPVRDGSGLGSIAIGPGGELLVAWQDALPADPSLDAVLFARSTDGGATWSPAVVVNRVTAAQAFTPTIAVRADGRIGITHFDFRDDVAGDGRLTTGMWLVTSADGLSWAETRVAAPFDLHLAPVARGYFLGDYMGLVASGGSFVPLFVQTNNQGTANRTDAYAVPAGVLTGAEPVAARFQAKPAPTAVRGAAERAASYAAVLRRAAARLPAGSPAAARLEARAQAAEAASPR